MTLPFLSVSAFAQDQPTKPNAPYKWDIAPTELDKFFGGPTRLTFKGDNVPIDQIYPRFLKAAGASTSEHAFLPDDIKAKTVTVEWKDTPFWNAATEVEKQTGLRWQANGAFFAPGKTNDIAGGLANVEIWGSPFIKVVPRAIGHLVESNSPIDGRGAVLGWQATSKTSLDFDLYFDPKFNLDSDTVTVKDVTVFDNTPFHEAGKSYGGEGTGGMIMPLTVNLPAGVGTGTHLSRVSGNLQTYIAASTQQCKIPDLLNAGSKTFLGYDAYYTIMDSRLVGDLLNLRVRVDQATIGVDGVALIGEAIQRGKNIAAKIQREAGTNRGLRIYAANGKPLKLRNAQLVQNEAFPFILSSFVDLTFQIDAATDAAKVDPISLEMDVPKDVKILTFPFEVNEVTVP